MLHPQPGITNRPPGHLLLASLSFINREANSAHQTLERLRALQERELRSDLDEPSLETGELGFEDGYDRAHLTVTVGFGKSTYELLGVPSEEHPQDLVAIPWSHLGDQPQRPDNGDLVLQVCSDSVYINEHVLRRVEEELGDQLQVTWVVQGHQRYNSRQGRTSREEGRALIGFHDGTSNLNPRRSEEDRRLVFVNPDAVSYPPNPPAEPTGTSPYGQPTGPRFPADLRTPPTREPACTREGAYLAARVSVVDVSRWDHTALSEQERTVGRFKVSGASRDLGDDPTQLQAEPAYAANQNDLRVDLNSHLRKVGPRGSGDGERRIFRRGYPLVDATLDGLQRGLVFICFGRTLSTQFEFMTRAWTINPDFPTPGVGVDLLRSFESTVLCGGYFFVPPVETRTKPWTWVLPGLVTDPGT
jgi:deferrochelatase/peroxidase EfeB